MPRPPARSSSTSGPPPSLALDASSLTIDQVESVARHSRPVALSPSARSLISASHAALRAALATGEPIYGVNTGFGSLSRQRIGDEDLRAVQRNLLRSHAAGVGPPLPVETVRAMLLLLAASLSRGVSGVRIEVVESVIALLNAGVTPVIPETGSVGASGDLAPLAHAALVLIGEGEAFLGGARMAGAEALSRTRLKPIELGPKEGLALINGTHLMAAQGALLLADTDRLFGAALSAAAMSIDACRGTDAFLDERVYAARNQPGPARIAASLRALLAGSTIIPSHREDDPRVQDPYSLRCAPAVLGAALDLIDFVRTAVTNELGAVTDNPLVFPTPAGIPPSPPGGEGRVRGPVPPSPAPAGEGRVRASTSPPPPTSMTSSSPTPPHRHSATPPLPASTSSPPHSTFHIPHSSPIVSAGNFHGMPIALPLDALTLALAHIAGIAERRVYHMLAAAVPEERLTPHLSPEPGLHSGLMITQYTAAACCNAIIGLATPATVANIPTCAGMEDYNSFGPAAGAKARRALDLATSVIAIELLCAAEGLERQRPLRSGAGVERAHAIVRSVVPRLTADRPPAPDISAIEGLIRAGSFSPDRA